MLFWLPIKILKSLQCLSLYKSAQRIGTDPVLTAMLFHQCSEVDWQKTAVTNGFFYDFRTGEDYALREESVRVRKCVRGVDSVSTTLTLPAVSVTFRAGVTGAEPTSIRQDYKEYHGYSGDSSETEHARGDEAVDLDVLLD